MTAKRFKVAVYDENAINGFAVLDLHKPNISKRLKYENVYIGSEKGCEIVCKFGNGLAEENEQLKQLLDYAEDLIQSHLSEHFIRQWRNFKTGHKEYNDFWEEKVKKHKELKEDVE